MRLVIPSNWQPDLVERIRGPRAHSVYAALAKSFAGSGRHPFLIPPVRRYHAEAHIREVHRAGLRFNYILNAPSLNNLEFTRAGQRRLHRLLEWIDGAGVDSVTVSIPYLLQIIKRHHPRLQVSVSTIADVDSPHRARFWEDLGADCITLSHIRVGRSFKTIKAIRQAVNIDLQVIANLTCLYQCPYEQYHTVTEGHASQSGHPLHGFLIDYCRMSCIHFSMNDTTSFLRSPWIRPEDQSAYEALGVNQLKLINRTMCTENIGRIVDAYRAGRYEGNLFDLLNFPPKPTVAATGLRGQLRRSWYFGRPHLVNIFKLKRAVQPPVDSRTFFIRNDDLDGFINHFLEKDCSENSCCDCEYCDETAKRVLHVDPEARTMFEDKTGMLLDGLISGDVFRWDVRGTLGFRRSPVSSSSANRRDTWEKIYHSYPSDKLPWNKLSLFPSIRNFLTTLPLQSVKRALDLGCGSGELTSLLQQETGLSFIGIDFAFHGLKQTVNRYPNPQDKLRFVASDALSLPFVSGSMDVAFDRGCLHSLHTGAERERYMEEVHRILRPGGVFILTAMGTDRAHPLRSLATRFIMRGIKPLGLNELEKLIVGRFSLEQRSCEVDSQPLSFRFLPIKIPVLFQCHFLRRL